MAVRFASRAARTLAVGSGGQRTISLSLRGGQAPSGVLASVWLHCDLPSRVPETCSTLLSASVGALERVVFPIHYFVSAFGRAVVGGEVAGAGGGRNRAAGESGDAAAAGVARASGQREAGKHDRASGVAAEVIAIHREHLSSAGKRLDRCRDIEMADRRASLYWTCGRLRWPGGSSP